MHSFAFLIELNVILTWFKPMGLIVSTHRKFFDKNFPTATGLIFVTLSFECEDEIITRMGLT